MKHTVIRFKVPAAIGLALTGSLVLSACSSPAGAAEAWDQTHADIAHAQAQLDAMLAAIDAHEAAIEAAEQAAIAEAEAAARAEAEAEAAAAARAAAAITSPVMGQWFDDHGSHWLTFHADGRGEGRWDIEFTWDETGLILVDGCTPETSTVSCSWGGWEFDGTNLRLNDREWDHLYRTLYRGVSVEESWRGSVIQEINGNPHFYTLRVNFEDTDDRDAVYYLTSASLGSDRIPRHLELDLTSALDVVGVEWSQSTENFATVYVLTAPSGSGGATNTWSISNRGWPWLVNELDTPGTMAEFIDGEIEVLVVDASSRTVLHRALDIATRVSARSSGAGTVVG